MTDIKVTQADREAAQVYADFYSENDSYSLKCHQRLAEAFARHRIEAQRPLLEALEAIVWRSNNDQIGTAKVIDMREIAETTIKQAKGE